MKKNIMISKLVYLSTILFLFFGQFIYLQNPVDSGTIVTNIALDQDSYTDGGDTYSYGQGNNVEVETITYNGIPADNLYNPALTVLL